MEEKQVSGEKKYIIVQIVAAFWGMHVLPAKHSSVWLVSHQENVTDWQTDNGTDRQTEDGQSDPYV